MRRCFALLTALAWATVSAAQPAPVDEGDAAYAAGLDALRAAQYDEAARLFAEAAARNPRHAGAHYGLGLAYAADSPVHDEARAARALDRALRIDPDNAAILAARLDAFRRTTGEHRAFSASDTRRLALADRLLDLDPASALGHEERALHHFLEFEWRRGLANRQGGWDPQASRGPSGAANRARARAEEHLALALAADPARASAHRLRVRLRAAARDDAALLDAARAAFAARPTDPEAGLYLGLAAYRTGDLVTAEAHFTSSLARLSPEERAAFEDLSRFLTEEERAAYAADSADFADRFWRARDPRLLTGHNERLLEHYARLVLADLLFTDPRAERPGWATPRGEVFVRYGPPEQEFDWMATDFVAKDFGAFERWSYGDFSLLFEDAFRSGDYDFWSSAAGEDDATRARSLFRRMPERFVYRPAERQVAFPFLTAAFKGERGGVDLLVPYGVPLRPPGDPGEREPSAAMTGFGLESGAFLLGPDGAVVADARRTAHRARPVSAARYAGFHLWADGFSLTAEPGAYTLAVEFEQEASRTVGLARAAVTLPSFPEGRLALSDLLPGTLVEEHAEGGQGRLVRRGFTIAPAPWTVFRPEDPLYLYFEVYGLALEGDRTRYEVDATLKPQERPGPLARVARRLFGRRAPSGVAVRFDASGPTPDEGQYVLLDTSGQRAGPYLLTLRIHDRVSGQTVEVTRPLQLE
ncbi:MAG TPA: GWxTD domain-containing protein [Rubricoccaceae bacterium]|nr:GWxTD domain-containing protein [Rubricoccaceae bacterium]